MLKRSLKPDLGIRMHIQHLDDWAVVVVICLELRDFFNAMFASNLTEVIFVYGWAFEGADAVYASAY